MKKQWNIIKKTICLYRNLWTSGLRMLELWALGIGFSVVWASAALNEPLVLQEPEGNSHVQPWFQSIQPDLIHLIKRSYVVTKRTSQHDFQNERDLLEGNDDYVVDETGHHWFCDRNFTGTHGRIEPQSRFKRFLSRCMECFTGVQFSGEIDFPGFVALKAPNDQCPYYVISVVLRGSQGEYFQPGSGLLGASWVTNYDVAPISIDAERLGFHGRMHEGYVTKMDSCNATQETLTRMVEAGTIGNPLTTRDTLDFFYTMDESILNVLLLVPEEERHRIRFVVTGHSQGGGLSQVTLPYIIQRFKDYIPGFLNNIETPRFFGYFLSAPRVAADAETVANYSDLVGHDNMINHFAFRDIVTMACLHGYLTLGHLACDSPGDVLLRGICSEISHNNRMLLLGFFKRHINLDLFDTSHDDYWVYREIPDLIICWDEIRQIISHVNFRPDPISKGFVIYLLNRALMTYRLKNGINDETYFDEAQPILGEDLNWDSIRDICRGDLLPHEIQLDQDRIDIIRMVADNISGDTVSYSRSGHWNVVALIDTVFDLLSATRHTRNTGGCREFLSRIFCCSWCCSRPLRARTSFFFDPHFQELVGEDYIDPEDYGITPLGGIPIIAYLHYGSGANVANGKLFDKYLPSRNLDHALANGRIVNQTTTPVLNSEYPVLAMDEDECI